MYSIHMYVNTNGVCNIIWSVYIMVINWNLKRVCEIDWYNLTANEDREFVETSDGDQIMTTLSIQQVI